MNVQDTIETKLHERFSPSYLLVENESHMHSGPAAESHFKVTVVSEIFDGMRLLTRHRAVNETLADELATKIHALAIHTYTDKEWQLKGAAPASPACRGGGNA